jgi:hypothetical protein
MTDARRPCGARHDVQRLTLPPRLLGKPGDIAVAPPTVA